MSGDNSFVSCPDKEFLLSWKAFLAVGNKLDRLLSSDEEFDLPADEELTAAFPALIQSHTKTDNVSAPASKELIDILRRRDLFPFLQGAIPLSCVAAIAILAFKFSDKGNQGAITNILRLFRVLGIPVEEHQDEWLKLDTYVDSDSSYLDMAEDKDTSSIRVLVLNKEGFSNVLGVNIEKSISEELVSQLALKHGMTPIFPKKVAAYRKAKKKKQEKADRAEIPKNTLDDLVLHDPDTMFKLRYLVGYAKKKKGSFKVLFWGGPGLGKTLAAHAISGTLQKKLITMDVSKVLSEFIGQSEKNLTSYFDTAEREGAILLVDEADSYLRARDGFSRHYELSHTNCLLSLLENRDVSVILCSNLKNSLDSALLRRMNEEIEFKMPGAEARKEIWGKELSNLGFNLDGLDLEALARTELSGGLIASAVKRAHMIETVMGRDFNLTTELLLGLANDERRKLGKASEKRIIGFSR